MQEILSTNVKLDSDEEESYRRVFSNTSTGNVYTMTRGDFYQIISDAVGLGEEFSASDKVTL